MHESYDYGLWTMVFINVVVFAAFAIGFLKPKKRYEWRTFGIFGAFIVALFTEMYGYPLTIYILLSLFGDKLGVSDPFGHVNGHLLGTLFSAPEWVKLVICQIGGFVMLIGLWIMGAGWKRIYHGSGDLVTEGPYTRVRHPQYSGLFLVTIGMLIQWPTILTLVMFPILAYAYYKLALREERDMEAKFGEKYKKYSKAIPRFVPRPGVRYIAEVPVKKSSEVFE